MVICEKVLRFMVAISRHLEWGDGMGFNFGKSLVLSGGSGRCFIWFILRWINLNIFFIIHALKPVMRSCQRVVLLYIIILQFRFTKSTFQPSIPIISCSEWQNVCKKNSSIIVIVEPENGSGKWIKWTAAAWSWSGQIMANHHDVQRGVILQLKWRGPLILQYTECCDPT